MTPQKEYREISLTQGQVAIVDAADFDWLSQWKWNAKWSEFTRSFYACRMERVDGKRVTVRMHRFIVGLHYGDKRLCDHEDRNTLNNRRYNLRIANHQVNNINHPVRRDNKSGVRGVCWHKGSNKWVASININGKQKSLGYFHQIEDAKRAYSEAEQAHFGSLRAPSHPPAPSPRSHG